MARSTSDVTKEPVPVDSTAPADRSAWWAAGLSGLAGAVLFLVVRHALVDDAYISLGYARNLAEHGHWGLLADRTANTQTSPLNCWLLAAGILVTGRPGVAVGALLVATSALTGCWSAQLARTVGVSRVLALVLVGVLVTSPLLVSTVGLETYLGAAVLVGVARYGAAGRAPATGLLCGTAVLVRPDLVVPAAVLGVGLLVYRVRWRSAGRAVLLALVVALPWHFVAWRLLGGFLPDTTWLKSMVTEFGGDTWAALFYAPFTNYGHLFPTAVALTVVPIAGGALCAVPAARYRREPWARVVLVFLAAGWIHFAVLVVGGAAPFTWYYAPLFVCSVGALAVTSARLARRAGTVLAVVLGAVCLAAAGPIPWVSAPMQANMGTSGQYFAVGPHLAPLTGGRPVQGPGEIGALAFDAGVPVVDFYGDRGELQQWLDLKYRRSGPLLRAFLRWNWTFKPDVPKVPLRYRLAFADAGPPGGRVVASWPLDDPAQGPKTLLLVDHP